MNISPNNGPLSFYPTMDFHLMCVASPANPTLPMETKAGFDFVEIGPTGRIATRRVEQDLITPFEVSFEQAVENFERLSGVFIEPDGFLMWYSRDAQDPWQLSGMLYDRPLNEKEVPQAGRVCRCEFKGSFPASVWQSVLSCLGTADERMVVYLQPQKCFVTVSDLWAIWGEAC